MNPPPPRELLAVAGLLLASLLWGSSFVALKIAFAVYDSQMVIFGRLFIASLCFLMVWRWLKTRVRREDIKYLLLMALAEPCLYFLFESAALTHTSASQAGMLVATLPVLVAFAAGVFFKERLTPRVLTGLGLAVAGALWLSLAAEADSHAPHPRLGNFYQFLAMVCATVYTLLAKKLSRGYNPWFLTALQAFIGSVFFLPFLARPGAWPASFEPLAVGAVLYLGVLVTLGAYGLYNFALSRMPASRVAIFVNLIPVFAVLLGFLVLGESFTPGQFAAALVVLTGVGLSQFEGRSRPGLNPSTLHSRMHKLGIRKPQ